MRITLPPAATKGRNIRRGVVRLAIKSHITSTQSRASVGFFAPEKAPPKWGRYTVPVGSGSAWQTACFAGRDAPGRLCLHYTTSGAKNRRFYLLTFILCIKNSPQKNSSDCFLWGIALEEINCRDYLLAKSEIRSTIRIRSSRVVFSLGRKLLPTLAVIKPK